MNISDSQAKAKYELFCTKTYIPIFSKSWWMDAVCGEEQWNAFVFDSGGNLLCAMPYYIEERNGFKILTKARHTQNNGIIFNYPSHQNQKYCSKLDFEEKCINATCDYIESLNIDKYEQQYHYSVVNWLPFKWRGYSEMLRYTYVIEDTSDMNKIESNFSYEIRNQIRKAEKFVTVAEDLDIDTFYEVNRKTYLRQGLEPPYSLNWLKRLDSACKKHNCCKNFYAIDNEGNIHSVVYIVWDEQSVYYLLSGSDPDFRSSQANSLLIREAIRYANCLSLKFDFEGSVIKSIEHMVRAFGGVQKPYFRIYKKFNETMDDNLVNHWSNDAVIK